MADDHDAPSAKFFPMLGEVSKILSAPHDGIVLVVVARAWLESGAAVGQIAPVIIVMHAYA